MNTHIITFIIIATGVMSGLIIAVIAIAISLEKLKEEISHEHKHYSTGWCGQTDIRLSPTHNSFGHCGYICRRKECKSHVAKG